MTLECHEQIRSVPWTRSSRPSLRAQHLPADAACRKKEQGRGADRAAKRRQVAEGPSRETQGTTGGQEGQISGSSNRSQTMEGASLSN